MEGRKLEAQGSLGERHEALAEAGGSVDRKERGATGGSETHSGCGATGDALTRNGQWLPKMIKIRGQKEICQNMNSS